MSAAKTWVIGSEAREYLVERIADWTSMVVLAGHTNSVDEIESVIPLIALIRTIAKEVQCRVDEGKLARVEKIARDLGVTA